jgi:hypothetical protein
VSASGSCPVPLYLQHTKNYYSTKKWNLKHWACWNTVQYYAHYTVYDHI